MHVCVALFLDLNEEEQQSVLQQIFSQSSQAASCARDILRMDRRQSIDGYFGNERLQDVEEPVDFVERLPGPLCMHIFRLLDVNGLASSSMVSTRWLERLYSHGMDEIWKGEFMRLHANSSYKLTQNLVDIRWRTLCQIQGKSKQSWIHTIQPLKESFSGHKDRVRHVRIRNNTIVSASWDKSLRVIRLDSDEISNETPCSKGLYSKQVASHGGSVFGVWFDGEVAVTCSEDSTIKIWHILKERCIAELFGHESAVFRVAMISREVLVSCARDFVGVWHWPSQRLVHKLCGHTHDVHRIQVLDSLIVTGSYDCTIRVWKYPSCESSWASQPCHKGGLSCLHVDSNILATGSAKGQVFIWDLESGLKRFQFAGHHNESTVSCILVSGKRVFSTSIFTLRKFDGIVCIWDAIEGTLLNKVTAPYYINGIKQDFGLLFCACSDGYLRIHDVDRNDFVAYKEHCHGRGALYDVDVQGPRAVTCGLDKNVVVWSVG